MLQTRTSYLKIEMMNRGISRILPVRFAGAITTERKLIMQYPRDQIINPALAGISGLIFVCFLSGCIFSSKKKEFVESIHSLQCQSIDSMVRLGALNTTEYGGLQRITLQSACGGAAVQPFGIFNKKTRILLDEIANLPSAQWDVAIFDDFKKSTGDPAILFAVQHLIEKYIKPDFRLKPVTSREERGHYRLELFRLGYVTRTQAFGTPFGLLRLAMYMDCKVGFWNRHDKVFVTVRDLILKQRVNYPATADEVLEVVAMNDSLFVEDEFVSRLSDVGTETVSRHLEELTERYKDKVRSAYSDCPEKKSDTIAGAPPEPEERNKNPICAENKNTDPRARITQKGVLGIISGRVKGLNEAYNAGKLAPTLTEGFHVWLYCDDAITLRQLSILTDFLGRRGITEFSMNRPNEDRYRFRTDTACMYDSIRFTSLKNADCRRYSGFSVLSIDSIRVVIVDGATKKLSDEYASVVREVSDSRMNCVYHIIDSSGANEILVNCAAAPAQTGMKSDLRSGIQTGGRSKAAIMRVVMQNLASLRYAYNKRLREKPGLKGKITVKFAIPESGDVRSCEKVSSTVNDYDLEQEIIDKISLWKFERINKPGDVTEVVYPFVFSE
jgi:hypothetical protein